MGRDEHPLVYSSAAGQGPEAVVPARTPLRLSLESKGRRGKSVTVVSGLPAHPAYGAALLKQLKAHCGAGGALKNGALEIQGDQRDRVQAYLEHLGFQVSRAGS
ncbi:MAG: translation initiation factor [SAR324 cluster bacterium]